MAIDRKCENCFFKDFFGDEETWTCKHCDTNNSKYDFFKPNEKAIRKDERNKILETISKVCTRENAKFCFQLDGKNYQVTQVGTIDSMEQMFKQEERNKIITLLESDLESLDLSVYDNFNMSENYAIKDYIESTIKLLEKE